MLTGDDRSREGGEGGEPEAGAAQDAFDKLLASLDPDRERAGEAYERLRRGLVKFFEWRGSESPEDLADQTLDRASRKIREGEKIRVEERSRYIYGVARNILKEHWRRQKQEHVALRNLPPASLFEGPAAAFSEPELAADSERRRSCLESCLSRLSPESRLLIVRYYKGERHTKIENRKALALELGVPLNALRIRCYRLRARLETCVEECLERAATGERNLNFRHKEKERDV